MSKKVVIAEDVDGPRKMLVRKISDLGYEVTDFENGKSAGRYIKKHEHDLGVVITDIEMPGGNGYNLIKQLTKEGLQVPVIVQASEFDRSQVSDYKGPIDFFRKPLTENSVKDLQNKVQEYLKPHIDQN